MSKRKNNTLIDMWRKQKITKSNTIPITKEDDVDDPSPIPSSIKSTEDQGNKLKLYSYQTNWEKIYDWLYFNAEKGGAFCKVCEKYLSNNQGALQKSQGIFICTPFTNYRKATGKTGKLSKHANSDNHAKAVALNEIFLQGKNKPIYTQMIQQSDSEKIQNRIYFSTFVHSVYFLAKEEIPHTTKYRPLLNNVVLKHNKNLQEWFSTQSERASYISKTTAIELLYCIGCILDNRDTNILKNKYFSLMADESTNIKNICEMTIIVRFVTDCGEIRELFLCIVELPGTDAQTITETIDRELKKRELNYSKLISLGFDGAANFSGSITGVRKRLSEKSGRDVPYIHCRAHLLSLALTSARSKYITIKRTLQVIKDIYKLFHKSAKREKIFHDIQEAINEKKLKIPETVDTRWLSNYRSIHAVKECYKAIILACEHIHKDGADLASLAGGILLEITQSSFLITLVVLDEALGAVNNLSKILQNESLQLSTVPILITSSISHLQNIADQCISTDKNNLINTNINKLKEHISSIRTIIENENEKKSLKEVKKFLDTMIEQMQLRFNKKSVEIIKLSALFESFESLITINENDLSTLCSYFPNLIATEVWADLNSFKYVAKNLTEENSIKHPLKYVYKANIGYENLKKLAECLMCIPVSTATAERSFSTMNRIMNKIRNRMGQDTLYNCMKISTEGPSELDESTVGDIIDLYARQKQRRIRLI